MKTPGEITPRKTVKLRAIQPDDIRIMYHPPTEDMVQKSDSCLTMDFHTEEGWLRVRLVGSTCAAFRKLYKNTVGMHTQDAANPKS